MLNERKEIIEEQLVNEGYGEKRVMKEWRIVGTRLVRV